MNAITEAFHQIILDANRAQHVFNARGPRAGLFVLAQLRERIETMMQHVQHIADSTKE